MLCKECGSNVSANEVFCPHCGAPLRVTADYDYIQAEIGVKVDQFLNDETQEQVDSAPAGDLYETDPGLNIIGQPETRKKMPQPEKKTAPQPERTVKPQPDPDRKHLENTIAVTRTLYVKDSIFADEDAPDFEEEEERRVRKSRPVRETADVRNRASNEKDKKKKKRTIAIIVIAAAVVVAAILAIIIVTAGKKEKEKEITDVISCSVEDGGSYTTPIEITLWSDQDYRIVYTLDGSEPSISKGTKYGQPIQFTNSDVKGESKEVTLTAYSYTKQSSIKAGELKITFTLTKSAIAPPVINPGSGDYHEAVFITISAAEDTTIYYTYDGSTPSVNSAKYTGPIEMKRGNYVLSAIAVDDSGVVSEAASAVFNLTIESAISYDQALSNVMDVLLDQELIESKKADESGYYAVPGGGTRRVVNGGEAVVDNNNYYVIQVDYMNDGSSVQATTYFGVNDQTGEVIRLNKSGMNFVIG